MAYAYRIGAFEVTNTQYAAFLNAVAKSNRHGMYNSNMANDSRGGIIQWGEPGCFTYAVKPNMGDKPVNHVSWYDAARFVNWLHNGQGNGSTETGAYSLIGNRGIIIRNAGAKVWLPSEDEWYKAAYFKGDAGGYWPFPTQSTIPPTLATADATGKVSNPGANVANYNYGADWNGQDGNVTSVGSAGPASASPYGTFDQGGNVWEWNDTVISGSARGLRGGAWLGNDDAMHSSNRDFFGPSLESSYVGFRVATGP